VRHVKEETTIMMKLFRKTNRRAGLPPGTVRFMGEKKVDEVRMTVWDYDKESVETFQPATAEDCFPYRDTPRVSWINIDGLHDTDLLKKLGEHFGLHSLVLEDIVNTHQRPKLEDHDAYIFVVFRMLDYDAESHEVTSEQLSLILGPNYVITFQERQGDVFEPVRERLQKIARLRKGAVDYLAYALLDTVIDRYFVILEMFGESIEEIENELVDNPATKLLESTHALKRELIILRKSVWPLREVVRGLEDSDSGLIRKGTKIFLRDLYDHTIQVIDAVESYRDMTSGLQDLYLSSISNKMNEVMKVLTIIATIFIPLSFMAGVFGMNFEFMPELKWKWSYPLFWVGIVAVGGSMIAYFRRKGWL
jgi:magnesium transporter